jgi:hypothetical protein
MMDADEKEIFRFLRAAPDQFIPANSISRHAGGKNKFRAAPEWARAALRRLAERGIVETDAGGAYRLKPIPAADTNTRRWVAPHLVELLRKSGKKFPGLIHSEDDVEAYYDNL